MNVSSVKHIDFQNQDKSSWIDDPFDLKGHVIGMTTMNIKQQLDHFVQELISNYGKYDYDSCNINLSDIPNHEKDELLRLYIENTGRELTECVNGDDFSIENEFTCALLSMLQDNCPKTRLKFAQVTRNNILTYYSKSIQSLLDDACQVFLSNINNEAGYYSARDNEAGNVYWERF